jgi:hypothetical protein
VLENIAHMRIREVWGDAAGKPAHHSNKAVRDGKPASPAEVVTDDDRVLVEFCCNHDSVLGRATKASKGCVVVRLTVDDDVTTPEGLNTAKKAVNGKRRLLWASMPCTGGAPGNM